VLPHDGEVAEDDGEQVVEVVSNAAGEDAEALELLGLLEMAFEPFTVLFRPPPLAEIFQDAQAAGTSVGAVLDFLVSKVNRELRAVPVDQVLLPLEVFDLAAPELFVRSLDLLAELLRQREIP